MNKILKSILITISIIVLNIYSFIVINFANYGLYQAISTFPEKCTIEFPNFCIGTPWYNQLNDLSSVFIYSELLLIVISLLYILKVWELHKLILKLYNIILISFRK